MGDGNSDIDGQWRWQLRWPTVMEMAMAMARARARATVMADGNTKETAAVMGDGDGNSNGTVMATAIGYCDVNSNCDGDGNGNGDGKGDHNGNGHGNGNNDKVRVASSCAGNVQCCGRGNTLPPPPWIQRKVHSPALRHGSDTAKSVSSLSRGRVPDSSPWIVFCLFLSTTVQFTEQPSVSPPHYSGAQEPCHTMEIDSCSILGARVSFSTQQHTPTKSPTTKSYRVLGVSSYIMLTVTTLTMAAARRCHMRPIRLLMPMRPTRPTRMARPMRQVSQIVADRSLRR